MPYKAMDIEWTTYSGNLVAGTATFVHWPYRAARWMGDFNRTTGTYKSKDEASVRLGDDGYREKSGRSELEFLNGNSS